MASANVWLVQDGEVIGFEGGREPAGAPGVDWILVAAPTARDAERIALAYDTTYPYGPRWSPADGPLAA